LREIFLRPNVDGFQVVHHSIQKDHVHLIVEATNRTTFSSGMRSLSIRLALRINWLLRRKSGKVLRERYHRRDLFSARQVRRVLVYVLLNGAKHKVVPFGQLDEFSSSLSFDGWIEALPPSTAGPLGLSPRTRLLRDDWRPLGLLSPEESIRWAPPMGPPDEPPPPLAC
jgi:hypothetical protein